MRRILLSGASSGIGTVAYQFFRERGYDIVTIGRTPVDNKYSHLKCDFAKMQSRIDLQELFVAQAPFDAFINCAGLLPGKDFKTYVEREKIGLFNINFFTPVKICELLIEQQLLNKGSVVILVSSISAYKGSFDEYYSASKGAINSFIKSLALKVAPDIRVVGVAPGMTERTRMTNELIAGRFEHTLKLIPTGKPVRPEEIASLFDYIINHGLSMTGNVIDINGGQYLR
jgi:3-oxoacyl-[acyl-carrier protein] reductase